MTKTPHTPAVGSNRTEPTDRLHHQALESAFLQLSFAMKVWHFVRDGGLQRETFDIALTAIDDRGVPYVMLEGEFHSDDDLVLAAENNISICFGAAAITLWEAIREHSGLETKKLTPTNSDREKIAGLAFAIRCCFAHGTAAPRWELTEKYRLRYEFPGLVVDLTSRQGLPFDYSDLGGPDGLRQLQRLAASAGLV
jgi:hypothetical protein